MREIKFRGFSISRKQWVYGYYNYTFERGYWSQGYDDVPPRCYYIDTDTNYYEVYSQSVGQYTGLKDKNGVEIYEGDIVKVLNNIGEYECGEVAMGGLGLWAVRLRGLKVPVFEFIDNRLSLIHSMERIEVIGNIYENPELLEVE